MRKKLFVTSFVAAIVALFTTNQLTADQIRVSVENVQPADGFYLTPVWVGFHDGSFDSFDAGSSASAEIEAVAEGGVLGPIQTSFAGFGQQGVLANPGGFGGAPVIDPGETAFSEFNIDPSNRYFSFLSMVIPSNDAFIGNDDAMAYELFNAVGDYNGDFVIEIFGGDIWDAGTETNDALGAAFSMNGGMDTPEALTIRIHPGLDNFIGSETAAGTTIGSGIGGNELLARISFTSIPEPTSMSVLLLGAVGLVVRRRR